MLKTEIPTPVAIGIIVAILLLVGFFVVRSLFAPAPTVDRIPDFDAPPTELRLPHRLTHPRLHSLLVRTPLPIAHL